MLKSSVRRNLKSAKYKGSSLSLLRRSVVKNDNVLTQNEYLTVFQAVRSNWLKINEIDTSNISSFSSGIVEVKCGHNVKAFILTNTSLR